MWLASTLCRKILQCLISGRLPVNRSRQKYRTKNGNQAGIAVHQSMIKFNTRSLAIVILVGLVWLCASAVCGLTQRAPQTRTEPWRKRPPKSDAPRQFKLPAAREMKLDNGLTLVLIEDRRSPVVTITVGIPVEASSSRDISELTNEMALTE